MYLRFISSFPAPPNVGSGYAFVGITIHLALLSVYTSKLSFLSTLYRRLSISHSFSPFTALALASKTSSFRLQSLSMSAPPNGQVNGGRPAGQRNRNRRGRGGGGGGGGVGGLPGAPRTPVQPSLEAQTPSVPASGATTPAPANGTATHLSDTLFRDIPGLSPELLQAIPFERCTEVGALVPRRPLFAATETADGTGS